MTIIARLSAMLDSGQDNALLRYSLGSEYFKSGDWTAAATHLEKALQHDPGYSAAWKLYGRALAESARWTEAIATFEKGIAVAKDKGDVQAAKEMGVFLKRAQKAIGTI